MWVHTLHSWMMHCGFKRTKMAALFSIKQHHCLLNCSKAVLNLSRKVKLVSTKLHNQKSFTTKINCRLSFTRVLNTIMHLANQQDFWSHNRVYFLQTRAFVRPNVPKYIIAVCILRPRNCFLWKHMAVRILLRVSAQPFNCRRKKRIPRGSRMPAHFLKSIPHRSFSLTELPS